MCDYTGSHFGASYPDACCIDGMLWDLDSCDEPGGGLSIGGDTPCPKCRTEDYLYGDLEDYYGLTGNGRYEFSGAMCWFRRAKKIDHETGKTLLESRGEIELSDISVWKHLKRIEKNNG